LAAVILTCEETDLDKRITEVLEEVDVTSSQPPAWFQREPGPDLPKDVGTMADTLRELSELSSLDARGAPDIAHILNRHLDQRQEHATFDLKRESWPQSEVLLSRSPTAFFQGTARCSSPFRNDDNQHETMLTAAEFIILETIVRCYTTLDLKAHFIAHLPNIEPLCMKLTVVNLSFNNFRVVPSQILTIKNLVNLNLRNNPIKELPPEIGQLRQLQILIVSFCLVSCIPVRLSFLPKEIGNLRSLREFSVEGNELGALPTGILQLKLKHFRMMNNFTHSLFWRETTSNQPQRLFHMAAQKMVSERYADVSVPEEIRKQIL
ncbi:Leucine-rich repeat-containing 63, partial [Paramuricea clavata]